MNARTIARVRTPSERAIVVDIPAPGPFNPDTLAPPAMYICVCNAVTDHAIRDAVAEGARTLEDLTMRTGCASSCATCRDSAQALLDELLRHQNLDPTG